jgi:CspA family cold shock protein
MSTTGTVKWFDVTRAYGFIAPDDGGRDVFVHVTAVERAGLTSLGGLRGKASETRARFAIH